MHIVIVYGTTEGQTRKIASFVTERLRSAGHAVEIHDAADLPRDYDLPACDRVVVAASLHGGRYQAPVVHFAARNRERLNALPAAFVSVSLSAAGDSEEDRRGLDQCVERMIAETGWRPDAVEHVAGAFRYTEYDFLKRWAMRYIAWRKGQPTDTARDHEYTEWDGLIRFVERFAGEPDAAARPRA
jgi:menaquinone-dependent protoporphyrinogen oxidase